VESGDIAALSGRSVVDGWNKVTVEISDLHDMEDGASTTTVNNDADFEVAQCLRVGQTDEHE